MNIFGGRGGVGACKNNKTLFFSFQFVFPFYYFMEVVNGNKMEVFYPLFFFSFLNGIMYLGIPLA